MVKTLNASPVVSAIIGAASAFISSLALMLLSAWVLTFLDEPEAYIFIAPKVIQTVSSILGGAVALRRGGSKLLSSLLSGLIFGGIILTASAIMSNNVFLSFIMLLISAIASVLGGIIFAPKEKSDISKRKAMMKKLK